MFLEISSHKAGKTTRLLDQVWHYLQSVPGECVANIVTLHQKANIYAFFNGKLSDKQKKARLIVSKQPTIAINGKRFYDEFETLPQVLISLGDYYSTSIAKMRNEAYIQSWKDGRRDDILLSLIAINGNCFRSFDEQTGQLITITDETPGAIFKKKKKSLRKHSFNYGSNSDRADAEAAFGFSTLSDQIVPNIGTMAEVKTATLDIAYSEKKNEDSGN